ncbi:MAG: PTS sugar transporter subunit IIA [Desulfobulbaceae bacterium]
MIHLEEQDIVLDMAARNKDAALRELVEILHRHCEGLDLAGLYRVIRERELIGSTGVGNGVAIPHGKVEQLDRLLLAFGRSLNGIGFDAVDNQPVHLLVMILSPLEMTDEYLHTLAAVSRLLNNPETRRLLRTTSSTREVVDIFEEANGG